MYWILQEKHTYGFVKMETLFHTNKLCKRTTRSQQISLLKNAFAKKTAPGAYLQGHLQQALSNHRFRHHS